MNNLKDPVTSGWLTALSDAYHQVKDAHTRAKLKEILTEMAATPQARQTSAELLRTPRVASGDGHDTAKQLSDSLARLRAEGWLPHEEKMGFSSAPQVPPLLSQQVAWDPSSFVGYGERDGLDLIKVGFEAALERVYHLELQERCGETPSIEDGVNDRLASGGEGLHAVARQRG